MKKEKEELDPKAKAKADRIAHAKAVKSLAIKLYPKMIQSSEIRVGTQALAGATMEESRAKFNSLHASAAERSISAASTFLDTWKQKKGLFLAPP